MTARLPVWLGCGVAGALSPLAFAPFHAWYLLPVTLAVLYAAVARARPRTAFGRGVAFGLGYFGVGASWVYVSIHVHGHTPPPLAALFTAGFCTVLALFPALACWGFAHRRHGTGRDALLIFPACWLLAEWVRGWLLTGFPWLYVGTPMADSPLAGWAPVTGVLGMGAVVTLTAAALARAGRERHLRPLGVPIVLWALGAGLSLVPWTQPAGPPLSVALVQGNIDQAVKWHPAQREPTLALYRELSEPLWGNVDLVVWPEAALPVFADRIPAYLNALSKRGTVTGTTLMTGVPTRARPTREAPYYNSLLALGNGTGHYRKHKLVPFGEFLPFDAALRGLIDFFNLPLSDFSRGPRYQAPLQAGRVWLGPLICYEVAYMDYAAATARASQVLVTVSNDSWFGDSLGPHQHLALARLRALENGRPMIRGTNNGISALIDARGHVQKQAPRFRQTVLRGTVTPRTGHTPFSITTSWPVVSLALLIVTFTGGPRPQAVHRQPQPLV